MQIDAFCEKSDDPLHQHNYEAPNRMNIYCRGRSAWEVMQRHVDFRDGNNPSRDIPEADLTPRFRILHQNARNCRVSLVVDRSGSMNDNGKMDKLKRGLVKFMRYTVKDGMEVGISSFR